jgi:hypothetical protein
MDVKQNNTNFFFTGGGGALYPPNSLHEQVSNKELFTKLAPLADDVWFVAMAIFNGTERVLVGNESMDFVFMPLFGRESLWHSNVEKNENDIQIKAVFDYFDLYKYLD